MERKKWGKHYFNVYAQEKEEKGGERNEDKKTKTKQESSLMSLLFLSYHVFVSVPCGGKTYNNFWLPSRISLRSIIPSALCIFFPFLLHCKYSGTQKKSTLPPHDAFQFPSRSRSHTHSVIHFPLQGKEDRRGRKIKFPTFESRAQFIAQLVNNKIRSSVRAHSEEKWMTSDSIISSCGGPAWAVRYKRSRQRLKKFLPILLALSTQNFFLPSTLTCMMRCIHMRQGWQRSFRYAFADAKMGDEEEEGEKVFTLYFALVKNLEFFIPQTFPCR